MSQKDWKSSIEKAVIDILWSHWIKLGAYVGGKSCQATCDPEALLLLTGLVGKMDLRLIEILNQWLHHYESLINIERLKTALKSLPEDRQIQNLCATLNLALETSLPAHATKRWKTIFLLLKKHISNQYQSKKPVVKMISRKKLQTHDWIIEHNPLLGFRYLVGVTAKADILYFLSTYIDQPKIQSKRPVTGANIAKELHYDPATILRALDELKDAHLVRSSEASSNRIYIINSQFPLFSLKPKADLFFLDWFALFPIFRDMLSLNEEVCTQHESIALDQINKRLENLDNLMNTIPRSNQIKYAKNNFLGVSLEDMWKSYLRALYDISDCIMQPRRLDWSADELTNFLDIAQNNLLASYSYLREFRILMKVDQIFVKAIPLMSHQKKWFEALFLTRCHSALRAAARLAASGQLPESFSLMRAALENALYAFHIDNDSELSNIWMNRNKTLKSKKDCKNKFKITPILKKYEKHDAFNGPVANKLYKYTIEHGAHPNPQSFFSNLEIKEDEKNKILLTLQLNTNEIPLRHAVVNVARTGSCCLLIFENIYQERFKSSGVSENIRSIIDGL